MAEIPQALLPTEAIPDLDQQNAVAMSQPQAAPASQPTSGFQIPLLQNDTHTLIPVDQDHVDVAVRSGLYSPKKDQVFTVKDPYGKHVDVDGANLKEVLDSGYSIENSKERYEREIQEKHGDSQGATFVEGVGRGALSLASLASKGIAQIPGLEGAEFTPDEAMSKLGLDPQQMRERADANPASAFLGQLAGQVAGPEAKLVGLGAKGLSGVVESTILKDAARAGVGKKIAASLAGKFAGGAVEGAYYATGDLISEDSLGKADANAENLLAAAGMGALFGGTIGGGIGAIEAAAPYVVKGAKFAAQPFVKQAEHAVDADVAAGRLLGLTPAETYKVKARNPAVISGMKEYLNDDLQLSLFQTLDERLAKNEAVRVSAGKEIESALTHMDSALEFRPDIKPTKRSVWGAVDKKIEEEYADWLSESSGPGTSKVRKPVEDFLADVKKLAKEDGSFGAKDLQRLKKMQDQLMNYEKTPGKWTVFEDLVHTTRTALKNEIDNVATKLYEEGTKRELAVELREANRKYAAASTFGDFLEKRAIKAGDKTMSLTGAMVDVGLDIKRKLAVMGQIERAQQSVGRMVDGAVKKFVSPIADKASAIPVKEIKKSIPASIIDSQFSKKFDNGKYKKPKDTTEAFQNMNDNFSRYAQNPEAFVQRANRGSSGLFAHAPNTSTALDATAVTAAMFLSSKLPKRVSQPGMLDVFNKPRPPSTIDMAKFERYLNAVENPKSVFDGLHEGRLSHESAEALRSVYPNLFGQLRDKVMEHLGKHPGIPYDKKLQLGILLDMPTDESLLPQNILGLQSNFQTQPEDESGAIKPTSNGIKSIGIADRMKTDTQDEGELA